MEYKVLPFSAQITQEGTSSDVAIQFQILINGQAKEGWEFVRMEVVDSDVLPTSGCFGIGAKQGYRIALRMVVFKK